MTFKGNLLFASHDHQFINSIATRVIEISPKGMIDKYTTYEEYIYDEKLKIRRAELY